MRKLRRTFNVNGSCDPQLHYMVDLTERLAEIKEMVDAGQYFTINRARQYGKTTILAALGEVLKKDYEVISLDFQTLSYADFENESRFVGEFSKSVLRSCKNMPEEVIEQLKKLLTQRDDNLTLSDLFDCLLLWCAESSKKIVLIIDEVDTASNNQVFVDFLAQLRAYYLSRNRIPTFQSVILAGVYDIRSIRGKIRPDEAHKMNSPWNIAAKFKVDMNFSKKDIAGMLQEYEKDSCTGMNIDEIAGMLYDYTSGYPYLVSDLCKIMDEDLENTGAYKDKSEIWTKNGVLDAVKVLLSDNNPLFESLIGKLNDYPGVKNLVYRLLFRGQSIGYNPDDPGITMAKMFGFIKVENGNVYIANRIFETRLYNMFLLQNDEQEINVGDKVLVEAVV